MGLLERKCTVHEINDVAFVGVLGPDGQPGYDLWVGGGLSTNPKIGVRLGAFVPPGQVAEVWAGVTSLLRTTDTAGYAPGLKFLIADWGAAQVPRILQRGYLGYALPDGPPPGPATGTAA